MGERVISPLLNWHETPRMSSFIINPYRFVGGGPSYLVSADFEETGTPSGWTAAGAINFDYTTSPIVGSQSLFSGAGAAQARANFTGQSTVYGFLRFRVDAIADVPFILRLSTAADAELLRVRVIATGALRIYNPAGTTLATSSTGLVADDTDYVLWFRGVVGTGSNGVLDLWLSADETKPGSPTVSATNGNWTANFEQIWLSAGLGTNVVWDKVRIDDADIGSSPT